MGFETLSVAHASTVDRVVEELRRALFAGEIEAGTPLREVALAAALGVSRSTVREAMAALVGEGLAVRAALADFAAAGPDSSAADLTAAHLAVHRSFVGLLDSPRLLAQAEALYAEVRLALARVDRARRNHAEQVAAHRALLALLEGGRVEEAAAEVERHLAEGVGSMLASLGAPRPMPAGRIDA